MAATEASHASWHPALMPHTADGIVASTPKVPTESPAVESFESEKQTIESHPEEPEAKENGLDILDTNEGYAVQDNSNHPELTNLRDALTTSLASPGGVEMEESPQHNGISHEEETIQEQPSDPPQAEFSTGSTYENKHQSTTSFARTVSQEVDLGEDDEVDPEWNLRRTDTDPFKFMAKSDRTNSFPAVPPIHPYGAKYFGQEPLAHSQAEDILGEVEAEQNTNDLFSNDGNDGEVDFFSQKAFAPEDSIANNLSNGLDIDSHYEQTFDGNVREGEDEESQVRYEEGLPLVQQQDGQNSAEKLSNSSSFFNESTNDDQEFFAQVSSSPGEDLMPRPEALARKSTMQVMNSMQFQPHESQDDILEEDESEEAANPQSPLDKANGGGLGASKSTILSQVLGDPESSVHEKIQGSETDEDLAAKWKAALDGDEFLDDDDELLDDDEPTNGNPIDPAAFFGSDDEGFLEDTEGQTEPNFLNSQQASPPVPAPMHGVDGKMMGFDSLTGSAHSGQRSVSNRYVPASLAPAPTLQSRSSYAPVAPLLTDLSKPIQSPTLASPYMSPAVSLPGQQQQQARPEVPKAQSFADKNKGGYSSPYDLPMEVVKPRKRVSMNNIGRGYSASPALASVVPPPRSSSRPGQIPSTASVSSLSPPTSSQAMQHPQSDPASNVPQAKSSPSKSKGGFFEELPMAPRPKPTPRSSLGPASPTMHLPQNNPSQQYSAPPSNNPYSPSIQQSPLQNQLQQQIPQSSLPQGLIAPERVSPYANLPSTANVPLPATTSRYSPAPIQPQSHTASPPVSRYSPAPPPLARQHMPAYASQPVNPQPPPPVLAHQPRTSSPLAHFERSRAPHSAGEPHFDRRSSSSGYEPNMRAHPLPPTREVDENDMSAANQINGGPQMPYAPQAASQPMQVSRQTSQTPPPPQDFASKNLLSPSKRAVSGYIPQQVSNGAFMDFAPPKRSQTQSPGTAYGGPKLEKSNSDPYQRPASVHAPTSPPASSTYTTFTPISSSHPRSFSQSLNYIAPTDGREHDPMQRWKGAPVFAWGVGGTIITSFPKDVPRYVPNQPTPMIIRSPGEVKIRNIKEVDPLDERLSSFPGPLKGKSKKKELLAWLTAGITDLEKKASEKHAYQISSIPHQGHEDKRAEERILLWKILRVFIEHDGILEGNAVVEKAVRAVLSPGLDNENPEDVPMYATGADLSGVSRSSTSNTMADPVDPAAVDQLKKHLLRGEREKAVWEAVDKRLWAHAMLISNTVSKDLYKQVAQEFVQKEVKSTGENTESLAALYEIFAGNFEESIDELVPPSARAGFKMVSTSNGSGPSKDHLEGLDRWRETLGLVLSNRSLDDNQALNALGKLLAGYGRAEAAHICFLFARSYSVFGGIDDPVSSFVLVGSDHQRQPFEFDKELEPVLLSEVYEYGLSMSATSVIAIPHLAVYKLQHAAILAEYGFRDNALQYCDALASSITSQTKRSPYYHSQLLAALDDLNKRLKQSPKDEKSTWISKPSMDKVSGSVWAKFNKFVAGDENDGTTDGAAAGNGSEAGPFARIAGDTPTISRSPSNSDLYGSYGAGMAMTSMNGATAIPQTSKTASRYAPGGGYTPTAQEPQMGSSYGSQPRTSFEQRSSSEYRRGPYEPLRQSSDHRPTSQAGSVANSQAPQYGPSYTPQSSYTPYGGGDSPYADAASPYTYQAPGTPNSGRPMPSNVHDSPQSVINDHSPPANTYNRSSSYDPHTSSAYEPPTSGGYEPPTSGYEPPSYEPPSYEPATMNDEPDSPAEPRPKKKGIMDDDDDYPIPRPSGEKTKAEKDREADEAFRRAAEEDAKRAKEEKAAPKKGGWGLGGWFGSKKETTPDMSQPGKPIKAKLGEASSFVYDPELKRWINKKGGADNTPTPSATPPPPRASGPPRTASGPPGMGAAPPSRPGSAASAPVRSTQSLSDVHAPGPPALSGSPLLGPSNLAAPPAMSRSVSNSSVGPPSRPGTSMSNASSIDDLLGPATGGRKGTAKGKKKGRGYIDVMGDKK